MMQMHNAPDPNGSEKRWDEEDVRPLSIPGPVVHGDHAFQLFMTERDVAIEALVPPGAAAVKPLRT